MTSTPTISPACARVRVRAREEMPQRGQTENREDLHRLGFENRSQQVHDIRGTRQSFGVVDERQIRPAPIGDLELSDTHSTFSFPARNVSQDVMVTSVRTAYASGGRDEIR